MRLGVKRPAGGACIVFGNGPSVDIFESRVNRVLVPTVGCNRVFDVDHYCFMWQGNWWKALYDGKVTTADVHTLQRPAQVKWMVDQYREYDRYNVTGYKKLPTSKYREGQMAPPGKLAEGTPCTNAGQWAIEVALHLGYKDLFLCGFDMGFGEGHCGKPGDDLPPATDDLRLKQRRIMEAVAEQIEFGWPDVTVTNIGECTSLKAFPCDPSKMWHVAQGLSPERGLTKHISV